MSAAAGRVVWVELATHDVVAATAFYTAVFGWRFRRGQSPVGPAAVARVGGRDVAGLRSRPDGSPRWTVHLGAADLERALGKVPRLGGRVVDGPRQVAGGRRVACVADPTGAVCGLVEGATANGVMGRADHGTVTWVDCLSVDPATSASFLEQLLGWRGQPGADGYVVATIDDEHVGGVMRMPSGVPPGVPSTWEVYVAADVLACCRATTRAGGTVTVPPQQLEHAWFAVVTDPTGAALSLLEPRASAGG